MSEWQHLDIGEGSITISRRALHGKLYLTADDPAYAEEISLKDAKAIVKLLVEAYGLEVLEEKDGG